MIFFNQGMIIIVLKGKCSGQKIMHAGQKFH